MQIKDVENLAELAKIELNEAEKKQLLSDMESILGYVQQIESVEVSDLELEYKNKNVWKKIQGNGMKADFSWELSAKKYSEMFYEILENKKEIPK